ncbi:aminoglycoside phosphotransferase family protein [Streptomyces sp. AK02-01A]|uniref:aminoglycoside phosphotransferase family protein n=1 Tax=Streptomyces sp. AK02-01A TaxID=3028648 RepID=UPI0029BD31D1|nr:aminoglycoside phosphotransferase family protein [Streptomyces sp. AK02-01A]MDX3851102.1 aminoglycoside phosphotransferase family protein [Streptomyces sp. AK02-01A]
MSIDNESVVVDDGGYAAVTPWDELAWRREALGWAVGELARHGLRPTGDVRARSRPWSVGMRMELQDGDAAWFKANPPASAFEAALNQALPAWAPAHVLEPLAVDTARAWSLLPDGGPLLRDVLDRDGGSRAWEESLSQYAQFQRETAPHTAELLALGVPDLRPERLAGQLSALIDSAVLSADERAALRALSSDVTSWCRTLTDSAVPATLDHSDLHEASVLTGGDRYAFFDWGDSAVAHPFSSLLVVEHAARRRFGAVEAPAALARLRDAYLEPWTGHGHSAAELRDLADLACRVGVVGRADSWGRVFPGALTSSTDTVSASAEAVAHWLRELLR